MIKKIIIFIANLLLTVFVGVLSFAFSGIFSTSLSINCELASDNTYTCRVQETVLGLAISDYNVEKVISVDYLLDCNSRNTKTTCSATSAFQTSSGAQIRVGRWFTGLNDNKELVKSIRNSISSRIPTFEYTGTRSPIWVISFTTCLTSLFLLRAVLLFAGVKPGSYIEFEVKKNTIKR